MWLNYFIPTSSSDSWTAATGLSQGGLAHLKDRLESCIAFALAMTTGRNGDEFFGGWVECVAISPGRGLIRSAVDSEGYLVDCIIRSRSLLERLEPHMPEEIKKFMVVKVEDLFKMDFLSHCGAGFTQYGMELAILICVLQIMFNLRVKTSDLFLGIVDAGTGRFYFGIRSVPEVSRGDILAARRGGVTRLFIGGSPTSMDACREVCDMNRDLRVAELPCDPMHQRMQEAAMEDLGPDVPPLNIIELPGYRKLFQYLKVGDPNSIFTDKPLRDPLERQLQREDPNEESVMAQRGTRRRVAAATSGAR